MQDTLKLICPFCRRSLKPLERMNVASVSARRTCPKCRTKWQIVASVLRTDAKGFAYMHTLNWQKRAG